MKQPVLFNMDREKIKIAIKLPDNRMMEIRDIHYVNLTLNADNPFNPIYTLHANFGSYDLHTIEEILRGTPAIPAEAKECPWCKEDITKLLLAMPHATNCCHCGGPLGDDEETEEKNEESESKSEEGNSKDKKNPLSEIIGSRIFSGIESEDIVTDDIDDVDYLPNTEPASEKKKFFKPDSYPVKAWEIELPPRKADWIPFSNDVEYKNDKGIPVITTDDKGGHKYKSYERDK